MAMTNLPMKRHNDKPLIGKVMAAGHDTYECSKDISLGHASFGVTIVNAEGFIVCRIHAETPQGMADEIARAIEDARDQGFEHGREYVRRAMGCQV